MVWFHSVSRKMPLTMSATPAANRQPSATARSGARPNPVMASPQPAAASAMARPYRCTRPTQPPVAETASAPADGAANSSPVAQDACSPAAMNGISAFG